MHKTIFTALLMFALILGNTLLTSCSNSADEALKSGVKDLQSELPMYIDEGMYVTEVSIRGNYVVYVCEMDEDLYDVASIGYARSEVKEALIEGLGEDWSTILMKKLCKAADKGIAYSYMGDQTGTTVTIYIEPNEL